MVAIYKIREWAVSTYETQLFVGRLSYYISNNILEINGANLSKKYCHRLVIDVLNDSIMVAV
jgi:hypothetical protein